ncbi:hypothetical protein AC579_7115 [Pseudocercospora musae]|uniref:Uncharacterized protein n=1 Tax=Pseudocercospora musae TaxID=113226 RepID=A0A139IMY4_9PEZI|nr:hypothetical protein AC579_7115 [Pseudocercospora musae]
MTPRSLEEPRSSSTLARERIQQQYAEFPEEEDEEKCYLRAAFPPEDSESEESEDEYIQSDEDADVEEMPSPNCVCTRTRNLKDDSDEPSPKRLRTQPRNPKHEGDDEGAEFDDLAYRKANECPPWHPSMPQPDEDDEEFKPVFDRPCSTKTGRLFKASRLHHRSVFWYLLHRRKIRESVVLRQFDLK